MHGDLHPPSVSVMAAVFVLCNFITLCTSQVETIDRNAAYVSGGIRCSASGYTECIVNCNVPYSCGKLTTPRAFILGPTQAHAIFTINCKAKRACYNAEIDASQAGTMVMNVYGGDEAARGALIYPPRWVTFSLTVNVLNDNSGSLYENVFSDITIITISSGPSIRPANIEINCGYAGPNTCENMHIQSEYVQNSLTLNCVNGGSCANSTIHSSEDGGTTYINCNYGNSSNTSTPICQDIAIVQGSSTNNVEIECDYSTGSQACNGLDVGCAAGECTMSISPHQEWIYMRGSIWQ